LLIPGINRGDAVQFRREVFLAQRKSHNEAHFKIRAFRRTLPQISRFLSAKDRNPNSYPSAGELLLGTADILVGQQSVQVLTPFRLHLLDQRLAKAIFNRHRDNPWALRGELIRCRYDDDERAEKHVKDALRQLTQGDGEPLMWLRISERNNQRTEQYSMDVTCGKLNRFLRKAAAADPIRLTQRPAPGAQRQLSSRSRAGASMSEAQSYPRRAVGACDEPTDAVENSSRTRSTTANR